MNRPFLKIALTLILFISVCHAEDKKRPPPIFVVAEQAVQKSIAPTALYSATVISRDDVNLAGEISGRLIRVAEVGDRFSKDAVVAKLDDVFIQQQIIEERATIQSEKAKFDFHSKEVERFQKLVSENNIARSQLDQAIADQSVARSNIVSATARLVQAQERLRRTKVLAPFDGVVSEQLLQAGEWAKDGNTIVRLVSTSNLEIQTRVPATSLQFITIGTPLTYTRGKLTGAGKVRALVPVGGDVSRLYELRISIATHSLSAGNLLRVAIPTAHTREAVLVPRDALVLRREGIYVFRINEQLIAERINVETGVAETTSIEVIGGIRPDDLVVTRGGENLQPGMMVTVKPPPAGS